MDETPIEAGRKSRGRMKTTYYWPLYGVRDEVVFPWFASRAGPNVPALLGDYAGTLLSDGYAAYAKNWLFCWTEVGAKYVGILQSLLVPCRLHRIHPYDYLVDVLQRIDHHPASQVHLLTPRLWKEHLATNPLRAPLDVRGQ